MRCWLLFPIFMFVGTQLTAQQSGEYIFRHLDEKDGLLHNKVFCITQDKKGFMWIATQNGLQRYDGLRFTNYLENLVSLSDIDYLHNIYADDRNNIWLKSYQIAKMDTYSDKLTTYDRENLPIDTTFHFDAYTDEYNRKWLLGDFGIYCWDTVSNNMKLVMLNQPHLDAKTDNVILYDSLAKCTWFKGPLGLMCFDVATKKIFTHTYNPNNYPLLQSFNAKAVTTFLADKQCIWIATWEGTLYKYNGLTKKIKKFFFTNITRQQKTERTVNVACMHVDRNGNLWLGTDNAGLLECSGNNSFKLISAGGREPQDLHFNYNFYCITEDRDGNLWIGTDKGISIFNPYRQNFQKILQVENNKISPPKDEIMAVFQGSNETIYIGTWGGGFALYGKDFLFKKNILPKGKYEWPLVWCFAENDDKTIWAGTQHGYLHIYDPVKDTYKTIHPAELDNSTIRCMTKDKEGNIWCGLHNGNIVEWEKATQKFIKPVHDNKSNSVPVTNIFIDKKNQVWASGDKGLLLFDTKKHSFVCSYMPVQNGTNLQGNLTQGVEQINDTTLAVASFRTGLFYFNTTKKIFYQDTHFPILGRMNVHSLKKDINNNLWFTTDYELYELKSKENKLLKYNPDPGLLNSSFELLNFCVLKDGRWLMSAPSDVVSFNPGALDASPQNKKNVVITGVSIFSKKLNIDSFLVNNKALILSSNQNFINIEFTNFNYYAPNEIKFSHQLSGIDRDWVNGDNKGIASYTNLPPGHYIFKVKSGDKNATSHITALSFVIKPPFYLTWWFQLLCLVIMIAIIYSFARWRIDAIRNQARKKMFFNKEMAEMEMKALRSQMNPHFIFNCINSIDALIQSNDKYQATVYLNKFAKLLRNILDTNKQNTVSLSKDVETLKLYIELEELRNENKFKTTFTIDPELLNEDYKVPPLIVQPFVENAILHGLKNKQGNRGLLIIDIKKINDTIQYLITDNGIGRSAAAEIIQNKESHLGMQMSYDRIKLFNKEEVVSVQVNDLYNNDIPVGTEIKVNLNII